MLNRAMFNTQYAPSKYLKVYSCMQKFFFFFNYTFWFTEFIRKLVCFHFMMSTRLKMQWCEWTDSTHGDRSVQKSNQCDIQVSSSEMMVPSPHEISQHLLYVLQRPLSTFRGHKNQNLQKTKMPNPASKDFDIVDIKEKLGFCLFTKNSGISNTDDLHFIFWKTLAFEITRISDFCKSRKRLDPNFKFPNALSGFLE